MSSLSGGAGMRWRDAVNINFAAQPTQTLAPDGNYTIAGVVFTKINTAQEDAAMTLTNGSGVVITPKSTANYGGASHTLPALSIPVSIIPNFTWDTRFRVWLYIASQNIAANYDQVVIGVECQLPTLTSFRQMVVHVAGSSWVDGGPTWNSSDASDGFSVTAPNTLMFDITYGLGALQMHAYHGDVGAAFTLPGMSISGCAYRRSGAYITDVLTGGFGDVGDCNILFGAARAGSGTALVVTVGAFKIEYLQ